MTGQVIRVLGPIELVDQTGPQDLGPRQRALLAMLAANTANVVSSDTLIEGLWGDEPPTDPPAALQSLVSRLRPRLPDGLLETRAGGYALVADPEAVDAVLFGDLLAEAEGAEGAGALHLLEAATSLWRGPAFGDLGDRPEIQAHATALEELRAAAVERRGQLLVEAGRASEAVAVLEPLIAAEPLRESARAVLMEALVRSGRNAEALRNYAGYRSQLADETGLEPSQHLKDMEAAVLAGELQSESRPGETGPSTSPFPLRMRPGTVERRAGERVAYATVGSGPHLVFMPGWISSLDAFSDGSDPRSLLIARLAQDFTVTVYDRYGTGLSRADDVDFSLEASATELQAVLGAVGEPATVLASSCAGPIALQAAPRSPTIDRLVFMSTFACGPDLFRKTEVTESLLALVRSSWGMGSLLLAGLIVPGIESVSQASFATFQRRTTTPEIAAGYLEQLYAADATTALPDVTQPALVFHYRDDPAIPLAGSRQLALGLAETELVVLDGMFHTPPAEHVERIATAIVDFSSTTTAP